MTALVYSGRVSDAARAFQAYRTYLAEETGLDPGAELAQLDADVLSGKLAGPAGVDRNDALGPGGSARPEGAAAIRSTIPVPATSLIGRGDTISHVQTLLVDHRLVTLTGVGGCGKTRLAIEVAARAAASCSDGACFADLSVIVEPGEVVLAVAEALRLQAGSADLREGVLAYLADKDALLVLDNCEHLIDACADFADAALRHSGGCWPQAVSTSTYPASRSSRFPRWEPTAVPMPSICSSPGPPKWAATTHVLGPRRVPRVIRRGRGRSGGLA